MPELGNARIDQLPQNAALKGHYYFPIRNMDNSVTERVSLSEILPSPTSGNFEWITDHPYLDNEVVTWQGQWYQANGNIEANIVPGTDPRWEIVSKSPSGFVFWAPGVYPQDDVFVLKDLSTDPADPNIQMFMLVDPTRPYVSSDFNAELSAGDWEQLFSSPSGGGGGGGGILERQWKFATNTTAGDPGNGFFRLNNSVITSITQIYFSQTSQNSIDNEALLGILAVGNRIIIQQGNDATRIIEFKITGAPVDNGSWWTVPVIAVDHNNLLFVGSASCITLFDLSIGATTAAEISFNPSGTISATNTQAAIEELDAETQTALTLLNSKILAGAVIGNEYYVSPTGNDSTAVIGSPSQPFTLQGAINACAFNDVIIIKRGTYTGNLSVPSKSGGVGIVDWRSKLIYIKMMDGAVVNGKWNDISAGTNYATTLFFMGLGTLTVANDYLFDASAYSSGFHIICRGLRKLETTGSTTPKAIFHNCIPTDIDDVDEMISVAQLCEHIAGVAYTSSLGTIRNCRSIIAATYLFECAGSGATLHLQNIDQIACQQVTFNLSASGALNYINASIKNIRRFVISVAFGDAYLGRIEEISDTNFVFTGTTHFISLVRPNGATDGIGYFLKMKDCHVQMSDITKYVVTSGDVKTCYIIGLTSNANLYLNTNFITNDAAAVVVFPNTYIVSPTGNDATGVKGDISKPFTPAGAAALAVAGDTISFIPGDYIINTDIGVDGVTYSTIGGKAKISVTAASVSLFNLTNLTAATVIRGDFEFILNGASSNILHLNFGNGSGTTVFEFLKMTLITGDSAIITSNTQGPMRVKGDVVMQAGYTGYFCRTPSGGPFSTFGSSFDLNVYNLTTAGAVFRGDQNYSFIGILLKCSYYGIGDGSAFHLGANVMGYSMDINAQLQHANAKLIINPGAKAYVNGIGKLYIFGTCTGMFMGGLLITCGTQNVSIFGYIDNCTFLDDQVVYLSIFGNSNLMKMQFTTSSMVLLEGIHNQFSMLSPATPLIVKGQVYVEAGKTIATKLDLRPGGYIQGNVDGPVIDVPGAGSRTKIAGAIKNIHAGTNAFCVRCNGNNTIFYLDLISATLVPGINATASIRHVPAGGADEVKMRMYNKSYSTMAVSSGGGVGFTYDMGVAGDLIINPNVEVYYNV